MQPLIYKVAKQQMERRGYNNFSAYVADLIRRDREGGGNLLQDAPGPAPAAPTGKPVSYRKASKSETERKLLRIVKSVRPRARPGQPLPE